MCEGNHSPSSPNYRNFAAIVENCHFGANDPIGPGSISGDPALADPANGDFRLRSESLAINGGVAYDPMGETDLAGAPRVIGDQVDIGCYEYDTSRFSCGIEATPETFFEGTATTLRPLVYGIDDPAALTYAWTLTSNLGKTLTSTEESPVLTIADGGLYDVALEVTDGKSGQKTTLTRPACLHVAARTNYLAAAGASTPACPWKTPETAGNDLLAMTAEALDGTVIRLGEGTFSLTNQLSVSRAIKLLGAGIDKTILTTPHAGRNVAGHRTVLVNNPEALLRDVTITGGKAAGSDEHGLALRIADRGGTVTRCRITGNEDNQYYVRGAVSLGSDDARLAHCIIDHNVVSLLKGRGGGLYIQRGLVENCLVYSNTATLGGGIAIEGRAVIRNCTVVDNVALDYAGGLFLRGLEETPDSHFQNVILAGNSPRNHADTTGPEWACEGLLPPDSGRSKYFASITENCLFGAGPVVGRDSRGGRPLLPGSREVRPHPPQPIGSRQHRRPLRPDGRDRPRRIAPRPRQTRRHRLLRGAPRPGEDPPHPPVGPPARQAARSRGTGPRRSSPRERQSPAIPRERDDRLGLTCTGSFWYDSIF